VTQIRLNFFYSPERVRKTTQKKHIRGNDIKMGGSLRTIFTADCPVLLMLVAPLTESTEWTRDSRICSIFNDVNDDGNSLLLQNTGPYYTALLRISTMRNGNLHATLKGWRLQQVLHSLLRPLVNNSLNGSLQFS
jgi:hypothetical protein